MPYIKDVKRRALLDSHLIPVAGACESVGDLTYALTRLVDQWIVDHGVSYATLSAAVGVVECMKLELYRRVVAPYEDTKIAENGDVYDSVRDDRETTEQREAQQ
jgi:hypothetical protein